MLKFAKRLGLQKAQAEAKARAGQQQTPDAGNPKRSSSKDFSLKEFSFEPPPGLECWKGASSQLISEAGSGCNLGVRCFQCFKEFLASS